MDDNEYVGHCFCGAIELRVTGSPVAMGYCHCESCRVWSASPLNAFTLWPPEAVSLTHGSDQLASYQKTDRSTRKWCTVCGGHVLTEHPGLGLIDVYAAVIPGFPFKPEVHVNYGETVLHIHDGHSKLMDMPKEMGGSGSMMAE